MIQATRPVQTVYSTPPDALDYMALRGYRRPQRGEGAIWVPVKTFKGLVGLAGGLLVLPFFFGCLCYVSNKWPWEVGK